MNAETKSSSVEMALSVATTMQTVLELRKATGLDEPTVRAELRTLAQQGQIEHIPGRGRYDGRYGLLRPIEKAAPAVTASDVALTDEGKTGGESSKPAKRLTEAAQAERDDFKAEYGRSGNCSCHLSAPCGSCTHPGNPLNQDEDESCWQVDDDDAGALAIPAPQYDPNSVGFSSGAHPESDAALAARISKLSGDIHTGASGMNTGTFMVADLVTLVRDEQASLRGAIDLYKEVSKANSKEIGELLADLAAQADTVAAKIAVIDQLRAELANAKALNEKLEHLLGSERTATAALREQLDHITHGGTTLDESRIDSYAVIAPKRPIRRFTAQDSAVKSAMAAASNGSRRGEVFAMVHIGSAKRGAVWAPAN